tara:strand:- start:825 stop:1487 length:663 start_codon:yes stop_codon:yes gene_type:complete
MAEGKHIAYYRVSTDKQGESGLGLEAQRKAVTDYLDGGDWELVKEYVEIESGRRNDRPELEAALAACRKHRATLVIARLDRLTRNLHFVSGLMESGVDFVAVDNPHANKFMVHILAAVAEHERDLISQRTKAALAAAKARGVDLGRYGRTVLAPRNRAAADAFAHEIAGTVEQLRREGATTVRALTEAMNDRGVATRNGGRWHVQTTHRLLRRLRRLDEV